MLIQPFVINKEKKRLKLMIFYKFINIRTAKYDGNSAVYMLLIT